MAQVITTPSFEADLNKLIESALLDFGQATANRCYTAIDTIYRRLLLMPESYPYVMIGKRVFLHIFLPEFLEERHGVVAEAVNLPGGGVHDFDPNYSDMHVLFRAAGPDFKQGYVKEKVFKNVDVYPLLNHLLGTTPALNDGTLDDITNLLK